MTATIKCSTTKSLPRADGHAAANVGGVEHAQATTAVRDEFGPLQGADGASPPALRPPPKKNARSGNCQVGGGRPPAGLASGPGTKKDRTHYHPRNAAHRPIWCGASWAAAGRGASRGVHTSAPAPRGGAPARACLRRTVRPFCRLALDHGRSRHMIRGDGVRPQMTRRLAPPASSRPASMAQRRRAAASRAPESPHCTPVRALLETSEARPPRTRRANVPSPR